MYFIEKRRQKTTNKTKRCEQGQKKKTRTKKKNEKKKKNTLWHITKFLGQKCDNLPYYHYAVDPLHFNITP